MTKLIGQDPLAESEGILRDGFYGRAPRAPERAPRAPERAAKAKPTHYKIVCISLYTKDIERLEALVADLKSRGYTKANKSAVIRYALDCVDVSKMPRGY